MAATKSRQDSMKEIVEDARIEMATAEKRKHELHAGYCNEEKVSMYLAPLYKPYFGNVMRVSINGISIFFRVDGSTQQVPKTFADEITSRRLAVDAINEKQTRMANIKENNESSPGALNLF